MTDKNELGFWMFSLDDPELRQFCTAQAENSALYYIVCIFRCTERYSDKATKELHLQNNMLLLVDSYLMPVYCRLSLKGYVLILTEEFCETDQTKALLKYFFFHNSPEAITDMGGLNSDQRRCVELMYDEYKSPYDDLQPPILRNLARNLPLLSSTTNHIQRLASGHLLNYALHFMNLASQHAINEKRKSFYADKIGITEKMLTNALQTTYGKTFREMLTFRILIEAMRQLVFSKKSITHIAQELNYDASDFNKIFQKWKGTSPKEYRTTAQEVINQIEYAY